MSTLVLDTLVSTSILDSTSIPVSTIPIFIASPTISTIVSILDIKALCTRKVEPKAQPSTKFLSKGKEIEDDIDLDEEIEIPKWDIHNLSTYQMHEFGEIL